MIATAPNEWPAASLTVLVVPVKVTVEDVPVMDVAEEVSHDPEMLIEADPNVAVAAPLDVRFPLKVEVDDVRVRMPDHVMFEAKVAVIPGLTVRLLRVWGTFTLPGDAETTTVEVPEVNVPAEVSIEVTVIVLPLAVRMPPEPTVTVGAAIGRFAAEVSRFVVEVASLTWTVPALRPRDAMVNVCAVAAVEANTTVENSTPARFDPAKVIVPPVAELNVTVAVPGDHEADVELFVQAPAKVQGAAPKLKKPVAVTVTFPVIVLAPEAPAVMPPARGASEAAVRLNVRVAKTPVTANVPAMVRFDAALNVTLALTERLFRFCGALIVPPDVPATKVDVPGLKVPAEVLKEANVIVEAFAVSVPVDAVAIVPVEVIGRFAAEVVRIVLPVGVGVVFWIVRLPAMLRPRVAIEYVTPAAAVVSKTRLLNSGPLRFAPANVIVWLDPLPNVTVPVPAAQEVEVDASVQEPFMVHASEPNWMNEAAVETFTFPVTVTAPDVLTRAPPLRVRFPFTVSGFVPFVRDPALTARLVAVSCDTWVRVPDTDREAKDCVPASRTVFDAPVKVTVDAVDVKLAAEDVSHDPPTLTVADANVTAAAPEEVRFPVNVGVEEVRVRVPEKVRFPVNEVEMPLFTVRLFTVWVTFNVPPEAFTTTVEVAGTKVPVLVSIDLTAIVEPFAARVPPAATVRETAVIERFAAEVERAVVPVPP